MRWWFKSREPGSEMIPIDPPAHLVEKYRFTIETPNGSYDIDDIPENKVDLYAYEFTKYGAGLYRDGHPELFIPASRITLMRFEKMPTEEKPEEKK